LPRRTRSRRSQGRGDEGEGEGGGAGGGEEEMVGEEGDGASARDGVVAPPELQRYTGDVGDGFLTRLTQRIQDGHYGEVLRETMDPQAAAPSSELSGEEDAFAGEEAGGGVGVGGGRSRRSLPPGVVLLAQSDDAKTLIAQAQQASADLLALFRVRVSFNRQTGLITNNTTIEVIDVASGRTIPRSKSSEVNNLKVQQYRTDENPRGDDPVTEALDKVFALIDEQLLLSPMPAGLKPEHVQARLISLFQAPEKPDMLQLLDEVRLYHAQELLSDEHWRIAYEQLIGAEKTAQLMSADPGIRLNAIREYLPAAVVLPQPQQ
jgi:hypothetical protein